MQKKKFIATYGPLFVGLYVFAFVILVTFGRKIVSDAIPGDIFIRSGKSVIFVPITSSAAVSIFVIVLLEMYRFMKRF